MRWAGPVGLAAAMAFALFVVAINIQSPRHDRAWRDDLAYTPEVDWQDGRFTLTPYRDWTYSDTAPVTQGWISKGPYALDEVRRAFLVVEPHPSLPAVAHTLVIFSFENGDAIGVSIEARKEEDEDYSPLRGTFNRYELLYQWASPKDLMTLRAVKMSRELYMYEVELDQRQTELFLAELLAKTESIARRPRFYNTLSSNCTNELGKAAGFGWDPAFVFTGFAGEALYRKGHIAGEGPFSGIKARARIDPHVRAIAGLDEGAFNTALVNR